MFDLLASKDDPNMSLVTGSRDFSLKNTEIYINVERTLFGESGNDEFTVKVAEKPEEIKALLKVGFEYICQKDNLIFLRKRK